MNLKETGGPHAKAKNNTEAGPERSAPSCLKMAVALKS